jgi:hypothetical protein
MRLPLEEGRIELTAGSKGELVAKAHGMSFER